MQENRWYSDKDNANFSTEQRTFDLINTLKRINKEDVNVNYIESHLNMIEYEFDDKGKLVKIVVNPNSLFTFKHESKIRQCDNSYDITKLLKQLVTGHKDLNPSDPTIDIKMVNESHCKSVKGTQLYTETRLVEGDTSVYTGGSKSRRRHCRKPMRKTRRGRGRKSKSRPKTHRRRRAHHSRAQKHKKYRSRRR